MKLLQNNFTIYLKTTEDQFYQTLKANVKEKHSSLFDNINPFYLFSKDVNTKWNGSVTRSSFTLSSQRSIINQWVSLITLKGNYFQKGEFLEIAIEQSSWFWKLLLFFFATIYGIGLIVMISTEGFGWAIFGLLFHGLFMFSIFYFVYRKMRKSIPIWIKKELIYFLHHKEHEFKTFK